MMDKNKDNCQPYVKVRAQCDYGDFPEQKKVYPKFEACSLTGKFVWDGEGMSFVPRTKIPDGTYTSVTISNGCVASFGQAPVAEYTPSDCCGLPGGGGGGNVTSKIVISPDSSNILTQRADGLYSSSYIKTTDPNVSVTGIGTAANPYVINLVGVEFKGIYIHGSNGVAVSGNGTATNQINIELEKVSITPGTYSGLSIDSFGRVIGADTSFQPITSIIAVSPLIAEKAATGSYQIKIDTTEDPGKSFSVGRYKITVTNFGVIKNVEVGQGIAAGSFVTPPCKLKDGTVYSAKKVSFNEDGLIISVEDVELA